jgi:hypothetical protein
MARDAALLLPAASRHPGYEAPIYPVFAFLLRVKRCQDMSDLLILAGNIGKTK